MRPPDLYKVDTIPCYLPLWECRQWVIALVPYLHVQDIQSFVYCPSLLRSGRLTMSRHTLTCVEGNMDVRNVSCVSSGGERLGMLRTKATWLGVAAHAVILYPAQRLGSWLMCIQFGGLSSQRPQHNLHRKGILRINRQWRLAFPFTRHNSSLKEQ